MNYCQTDGAIMDSGACTWVFLDKHQHEFQLAEFAIGCSIDVAPEDKTSIHGATKCHSASSAVHNGSIIENRALHGPFTGFSPSADAQFDSGKDKTSYERMAVIGNSSSYRCHGKIYHLGMYDYHDCIYAIRNSTHNR